MTAMPLFSARSHSADMPSAMHRISSFLSNSPNRVCMCTVTSRASICSAKPITSITCCTVASRIFLYGLPTFQPQGVWQV